MHLRAFVIARIEWGGPFAGRPARLSHGAKLRRAGPAQTS